MKEPAPETVTLTRTPEGHYQDEQGGQWWPMGGDDVPETQFFKVSSVGPDSRNLEHMPDITSVLELGPGYFVAKPVEGKGCWMHAVSFRVLATRLWEQPV